VSDNLQRLASSVIAGRYCHGPALERC